VQGQWEDAYKDFTKIVQGQWEDAYKDFTKMVQGQWEEARSCKDGGKN
jgi:hypothetical protein